MSDHRQENEQWVVVSSMTYGNLPLGLEGQIVHRVYARQSGDCVLVLYGSTFGVASLTDEALEHSGIRSVALDGNVLWGTGMGGSIPYHLPPHQLVVDEVRQLLYAFERPHRKESMSRCLKHLNMDYLSYHDLIWPKQHSLNKRHVESLRVWLESVMRPSQSKPI